MKALVLLVGWASLAAPTAANAGGALDPKPAQVAVCFTPPSGCSDVIEGVIGQASKEILVQAYEFTDPGIESALVQAKARGVDVRILLDRHNETERWSQVREAVAAGIPVSIDAVGSFDRGIAHVKAIIIDRSIVIGGSFNHTRAADRRNVEDVTVTYSPDVAEEFVANWAKRQALSDLMRPE